jgi:transitional endoplasmic reticulum ATPase
VVVLAATNRPEVLDSALLRAGRFEVRLELPEPDREGRLKVFTVHTREKPLADEVDLRELAAKTEGFVGSDIEAICRRASMEAIREFVEADGKDEDAAKIEIGQRHFDRAIEEVSKLRAGVEAASGGARPAGVTMG